MKISTEEKNTTHPGDQLIINSDYLNLLEHNGITSAEELWNMESSSVKSAVKTRGTSKAYLKFPDGKADVEVYIKRYLKPSWKDRIKCLASFKPVFMNGAFHEWDALCRFHELGLNTMIPIAVAECGAGRSCNLTLGITDYIRASDLFADTSFTDAERRKKIIKEIAVLLGSMHKAGLAHQDFYLVHLFIKPQENDAVFLIDLQRTIIQQNLSLRWRIKDAAQIQFALTPFLSADEMELFKLTYLENSSIANERFWSRVAQKAERIKSHTIKRQL